MSSKRDYAAKLLDLSHEHDMRGPRTGLARDRIADALDTGRQPRVKDIAWLEHVVYGVASIEPEAENAS